ARCLTALYAKVEEKDLRKLIKKALFHLKTQGIQTEAPVAPGEPVLRKVAGTAKEQIAFTSNYDHEATRVLLIAFEVRRKQFIFTHATQRFGEGLVDMMSAPMDRQGLDGLIRDYRSRTRGPMVLVDISPSYAMYLMEEAARQSGRQAEEIKGLKRLTADFTGDIRAPSDIYRLKAPETVAEIPWQEVVDETVFGPFNLPWKDREGDRKEYDAIAHPQIVLPPHVIAEKRAIYLKGLVASEKMKPLRQSFSRMLEDYAYLFFRQSRYAHFAALLKALGSAESLDAVIQVFLAKSIDQESEKKQQQQSGLIVSPYSRNP
ncbi:MAG TPA: hypothetical protein DCR97_11640, partial [Deltaproteobacteria bacterium]|nr:hypothetical protein [Deltaproteobacteria bacterium]